MEGKNKVILLEDKAELFNERWHLNQWPRRSTVNYKLNNCFDKKVKHLKEYSITEHVENKLPQVKISQYSTS